MLKRGVRTIGIDDGPFHRGKRGDVLVVGAVYRGGTWFDGLLTTKVRQDGWNGTDRLVEMITQSKFHAQLHYIMLDGVALGGFNIVDIDRLQRQTGLKVMVVVRKRPNFTAVRQALNSLSKPSKRWQLLQRAGEVIRFGKLYGQLAGLDAAEAAELLDLTCTRADLPEPLRAAHLIAGGLVRGQSGRRA